ncbi:MAG: glycosyltransferase [Bacilli bacterium]|nr:glycosyltransferase [Bacilli bacterium]
MKKKNVALVFGITSNYVFALANTLIGLVKHNKKFWDDIIVYYDTMNDNDKENLNSITKCTFIKFSEKEYLKTIPQETLMKYSEACFYRYECFNLLKEYKNVIWNDVDILIKDDISGLLDYAQETGFAATVSSTGFNNEANFFKLIMEYNMYAPLYNSGILVLNEKLKRYEEMCDWCINKTVEYSSILRWPDQGILNLLIQEFDIKVDLIDINKYCCHPSLDAFIPTASIIHAYGDAKFWSDINLNKKFPEWEENNSRWLALSKEKAIKLKEEPLVSCIMSTYNRYDHLKESVDSILNQTYKNIELIVVLEKCENQLKIEKILKEYNDARIKIIKNKEKLGFPLSLNVGIDAAKGKYLARMDDDDISLPERFIKQVKFLEENPDVGICGTNAVFFGKYNSEIGVKTNAEELKVITLYRTPFIHPTVMMNADLINKYNLRYDKDYFTEDYELWSRAVSCFKFANINEILLKYRCGDDNLTSGSNETKIHTSHKRIMKNQFKKYLDLDLNENEIEILQGRKNNFEVCFNFDESIKLKKTVSEKIIEANKKKEFYDPQMLEDVFYVSQFNDAYYKTSIIKKVVKTMIRPVYGRLMAKVDHRIMQSSNSIRGELNYRIEKLEKELKGKND